MRGGVRENKPFKNRLMCNYNLLTVAVDKFVNKVNNFSRLLHNIQNLFYAIIHNVKSLQRLFQV